MPVRPIVKLIDGLITKYTPEKAGGYKTLQNIDQDIKLGAISTRKAFTLSPLTTFFYNFTDSLSIVQSWRLKNNKLAVKNAKDINGETGSVLTIENADNSVTNILDQNSLLLEPYGMKCVDLNYTFVSFLGTLLMSGGVDYNKNRIQVINNNQVQVIISTAPDKTDLFFSYGADGPANVATNIASFQGERIAIGRAWHRYMYKFLFSDGTESAPVQSADCYYADLQQSSEGTARANEIILHLQRNLGVNSFITVDKIKVYRNTISADYSNKPDLTQFDNLPYQLLVTIEGDLLNGRETGDTIQDNYVRYTDNKWLIGLSGNYMPSGSPVELLVPWEHPQDGTTKTEINGYLYLRFPATEEYNINDKGSEIYIPKPCYIEAYNNRLMAMGDPLYPRNLFFSKDEYTDFFADNSVELPFPSGDTHGTAMIELGNNLYCFSEHSTIRVTETSTEMPYYQIEPVEGMQGIGCIAPNTIIKAFGRIYFLSREGFIEFNGVTFKILSTEIDDVIKSLDFNYYDARASVTAETIVSNPMKQPCYYKPYLSQATYNADDTCIYLILGTDDNIVMKNNNEYTIPTLKANVIYKFNIKLNKWSTVLTDNFYVNSLVKSLAQDNGLEIISNGLLILFNKTDETSQELGTGIVSTVENNDIDLGDTIFIKSIRFVGKGTVNIYIYKDKSDTAKVTKLSKELNENKGTEVILNFTARYLRFKIEAVSTTAIPIADRFQLTQDIYLDAMFTGHKTKEAI